MTPTFIVDTREQKPYSEVFDRLGHKYNFHALPVGDYSLAGYEQVFSLERKSLGDLIDSVTRDRERFERELERAKAYKYFAVIIECSFFDIVNHNYISQIAPNTLLSIIFHWNVKYNIPFLFVESRSGGALAVIKMSQAFLKYHGDENAEY